jgi:nicotinamidase-related amidase
MTQLAPGSTALILIDLQEGIVSVPFLAPRSGADVAVASSSLARRFRSANAPVVLVNVGFAADFKDALSAPVDRPFPQPPGGLPENFSQLVDGLAEPGDIRVTKQHWGAFYGTNLDVQLRRRHVQTVVIGGIATNLGVESTARQAYEHGYEVILVEDLTTSISTEMHSFAIENIFPLIARLSKADDLNFVQ